MSRQRIRQVRGAAAYLVAALPAIALVLLVGGERVQRCLSLHPCQPISTPGPIPILGTTAGAIAATTVLGVVGVLAAAVLLSDLLRHHRRAVVRLALVVGIATCAAAMFGSAVGWSTGHRLRAVAETAAWWAAGAALVGSVLGLAATAWLTTLHPPDATTGAGRR